VIRAAVVSIIAIGLLAGCTTSGKPEVVLSPEQQKKRDQVARVLFAKLILRHPSVGASNWLAGRREYINVRVSGPIMSSAKFGIICAKVATKDNFGSKELDVSASITDGVNGLNLSMARDGHDWLGQRCPDPYVPFPEVTALSAQAS
jgi:hypothetical protein